MYCAEEEGKIVVESSHSAMEPSHTRKMDLWGAKSHVEQQTFEVASEFSGNGVYIFNNNNSLIPFCCCLGSVNIVMAMNINGEGGDRQIHRGDVHRWLLTMVINKNLNTQRQQTSDYQS